MNNYSPHGIELYLTELPESLDPRYRLNRSLTGNVALNTETVPR